MNTYEWKLHRRIFYADIRPYRKGENLTNVTVYNGDKPLKDLGYIARNPMEPDKLWYVSKSDYLKYYEQA